MRYVSSLAALLVALAYGNAQATQIVNDDDAAYTVTVVSPDGERALNVAAGAVLENVCPAGCTLILGEGQVVATADNSVHISKGKIALDN